MQEILQQLSLEISQTQKCTASDFHAKLSVLLESERVSEIQEALSFLRLCGWLKSDTLKYYLPKMSRGFSTTTTEEPSEQSSEQWMSWGTMQNGRYLTANTLESPRIGKGCSLSDILEPGGGTSYKVFPFQADDTPLDELQGHGVVSNTLDTRITANTRGTYPIIGGESSK